MSPPSVPTLAAALLALLVASPPPARAASGWRGDGTGRYPEAQPPLHWSTTDNVAWSTPMPSWGYASPVSAGDRICVTSEPSQLLCVSARDGRLLWKRDITFLDTVHGEQAEKTRRDLAEAERISAELAIRERELAAQKRAVRKRAADAAARERLSALSDQVNGLRQRLAVYDHLRPPDVIPRMGSASSTPVTDGKTLYAVFGNGVVAAVGLDGTLRWARWLGAAVQPMHGYHRGQAASPLLVGGRLIVALNDLVALSPEDGHELWRGPRWLDFGTPAAARVGDRDVLLAGSGSAVDAATGKVLAKDLAELFYIGPVVDGRRVYFVGGGSDSQMLRAGAAFELATSGTSIDLKPLWRRALGAGTAYATPLIDRGLIYAVSHHRELLVLDADTGGEVYRQALDLGHDDVFSSPALAGDRLYVSAGGQTLVLRPGRTFEVLARNQLEDFLSSPLFVGDRMYVRGTTRLWCISEGGGR